MSELLNGKYFPMQAGRVLSDLFTLCPNAKAATETAAEDIENVIKSLGLQNKRARMIRRLSEEYLGESWTHVTELHGVGKYVASLWFFYFLMLLFLCSLPTLILFLSYPDYFGNP